ncbi:MAG: YqaE/Pmp3 family membrane protein [Chitinophagales bacterium]|nr:YqaE/Pmp3 family membrane protein [Chitinophagales bacterium]
MNTSPKSEISEADNETILYALLALFIPPLAVALYEDDITSHFWIALLLTLLFFLPGVIYALVIILGDNSLKN